jgi:hypothetical protein
MSCRGKVFHSIHLVLALVLLLAALAAFAQLIDLQVNVADATNAAVLTPQ